MTLTNISTWQQSAYISDLKQYIFNLPNSETKLYSVEIFHNMSLITVQEDSIWENGPNTNDVPL